jgi:hypothetical protein
VESAWVQCKSASLDIRRTKRTGVNPHDFSSQALCEAPVLKGWKMVQEGVLSQWVVDGNLSRGGCVALKFRTIGGDHRVGVTWPKQRPALPEPGPVPAALAHHVWSLALFCARVRQSVSDSLLSPPSERLVESAVAGEAVETQYPPMYSETLKLFNYRIQIREIRLFYL